jgi:predicted CoA-binding protein
MDWRSNLVTSNDELAEILRDTKRIAVLGIKPETHSGQPAFYVSNYMQSAGYEIIPVPVYYPDVTDILGERVYRDLRQVPGSIDMVNVFRLPHDIPKHTDELLEAKPKSVWIQLGIRNDEVAETLAKAGIKVVQDLCLMVEHRALIGRAKQT